MVFVKLVGTVCREPKPDDVGAIRFAVEVAETYIDWVGRAHKETTVYRIRATLAQSATPALGERTEIRGRLAHRVWVDRSHVCRVAIEVTADEVRRPSDE